MKSMLHPIVHRTAGAIIALTLVVGMLATPVISFGAGVITQAPFPIPASQPYFVSTSTHPAVGQEVWNTYAAQPFIGLTPAPLGSSPMMRIYVLPFSVVTKTNEIAAFQDNAYFLKTNTTNQVFQIFDAGSMTGPGTLIKYTIPYASQRLGLARNTLTGQPWFSEYSHRSIATLMGTTWMDWVLPASIPGRPRDLAVWPSPGTNLGLVAFILTASPVDLIGVLNPATSQVVALPIPLPAGFTSAHAQGITIDQTGTIWFTEPANNQVVSLQMPVPSMPIPPNKVLVKAVKYPVPVKVIPITPNAGPQTPPMLPIVPVPAGPFIQYPLPIANSRPMYIAAPANMQAVSFTAPGMSYTGRLWYGPATLEPFTLAAGAAPWGITNGFTGADVYFTEMGGNALDNLM